ncbi:hypothetical protein J2Z69_003336 [Paenibacillus shirakamiensis]|uniref:ABC transporter permease n=1 Tax=Paenibacillus shirakamiensis TaxID=1265935 RepID=A0ABS4JKM3_9BACL|nr:hypothetical protein [Paenibacillus shirakamiensis]MBP2002264.1 hypothetical protein [Paenibacillus shirakamiensis]
MKWISKGITPYYLAQLYSSMNRLLMIVFVLAFTLWNLVEMRSIPDSTVEDVLIHTFWGHGHSYVEPLPFFAMFMSHILPIYMLSTFLEHEQEGYSLILTVRLRSKRRWALSILGTSTLFLISYSLLLPTCSLFIAIIARMPLGKSIEHPNTHLGTTELVLYITGMTVLDLMLQFFFLFVIFLLYRQVTIGFVVILLLYGLYLLPFSWVQYTPVGMSSLSQHSLFTNGSQGLSENFILLLLAGLIALLLSYILLAGYKKRFQ